MKYQHFLFIYFYSNLYLVKVTFLVVRTVSINPRENVNITKYFFAVHA